MNARLGVLSIVLVGLATLMSCTAQRTGPSPTGGEQGAAQASYMTARTLDELIAQSPVIVVGRVIGTREIVNMARKPSNPREPDPETFILGQVYDVAVERYLKGTRGDILHVVQSEGFINVNRTPLSEQTIQQAREIFPHIPMEAGKTYLLFLAPLSWDPQYLAGRLHPWRFVLTPDGTAEPESPWHDAPTVFPPTPAEHLLSQVEEMANQDSVSICTCSAGCDLSIQKNRLPHVSLGGGIFIPRYALCMRLALFSWSFLARS